MKSASFIPFVGVMFAAWGLYEIANLVFKTGYSSGQSNAAKNTAIFAVAPGISEVGSINSTGGFTAAPDPNGIGGGFAT